LDAQRDQTTEFLSKPRRPDLDVAVFYLKQRPEQASLAVRECIADGWRTCEIRRVGISALTVVHDCDEA
jgi:hypothetical protein